MKLALVLGILFLALFIILPIVEKTAKPVTETQMKRYQQIFAILMLLMVIALTVRACSR